MIATSDGMEVSKCLLVMHRLVVVEEEEAVAEVEVWDL